MNFYSTYILLLLWNKSTPFMVLLNYRFSKIKEQYKLSVDLIIVTGQGEHHDREYEPRIHVVVSTLTTT